MEEAVGFRNVLAHGYGDVNHDVVYDVLHDDLHWFDQFQQETAQWFQHFRGGASGLKERTE
ncbi:HepT-like ribonuclease domain-containing protein [Haloferax sp. ATB1]|uniref:HepT-like ribonuclease domain-containing protein n=1 Tax=Haloferax sp. ATB1 TaxID=1508454 RepID=UPI000AE7C7FD|nr:HepT-like ribonuclease domain-containing protein [Haloferax sp. ATB1]